MKRHRPRPGPSYWEWRCRECGRDVKHTGYHLRWWERGPDWHREFIANLVLALFIVGWIVAIIMGGQR